MEDAGQTSRGSSTSRTAFSASSTCHGITQKSLPEYLDIIPSPIQRCQRSSPLVSPESYYVFTLLALTPLLAPSFEKQSSMEPFILAALTMVSIVHAMAAVSRPVAGYILSVIQVVLVGALSFQREHTTPLQEALKRSLPKDVRTSMKLLGLVPDIVTYGCCRKCFAIYSMNPSKPDDPLPRFCCHKSHPTSPPCNEPLVYEKLVAPVRPGFPGRSRWLPFRTYPLREFQGWLAELLLRPGIEKFVHDSWKAPNSPDTWHDIMQAPAIRSLIGPDGKTLFSEEPDGEIHLVFSLFVDWFNPRGNKAAGKSHSVGAIYLACMNLPPHLRYRPENIYLAAIIPGPHEPKVSQLNHLLRPIVDQLLVLWNPGIYLEKTSANPGGCRVRVAMIPLVCDLPALRKTAGLASYSHLHFCNFCNLLDRELNNVDRATWPPGYSWTEHLRHAKAWLDAPTRASRKKVFDAYGIRWSELLRLPYWDPTRYALVDSMHNLFLGELRHHCIKVWGFKTAKDRGKPGRSGAHPQERQEQELRRIWNGLNKQSDKTIAYVRRDYIVAFAQYNNIPVTPVDGTRADYARDMVKWVGDPFRSKS